MGRKKGRRRKKGMGEEGCKWYKGGKEKKEEMERKVVNGRKQGRRRKKKWEGRL